MASEDSGELSINAAIEYPADDEVIPVFANNTVVQVGPDGFVIGFYSVFPPVIVGSETEAKERLAKLTHVRAKCVARILLSPDQMEKLASVIQQTLLHRAQLQKKAGDGD